MVLMRTIVFLKKNLKNSKIFVLQMDTNIYLPVVKILWSETVSIARLLMSFALINGTVYMAMTKRAAKKSLHTRPVKVVVCLIPNQDMPIWVGQKDEQNSKKMIIGGYGQVHFFTNRSSNVRFIWLKTIGILPLWIVFD